jgi:hypothetical protein
MGETLSGGHHYDAAVLIEIRGRDLPGRRVAGHDNVHVGIQRKRTATELVAADVERARWELIVDVTDEGDVKGPHVQGRKGDRFVYLTWNDVAGDGSLTMVGRTKLMLAAVPADVFAEAGRAGWRLVGELGLTDERGKPRFAAVRPPVIAWSAAWPA